MWRKLVYGQALPTHTSLQTNSSLVNLSTPKKSIRVIDIPGHPRIRDQFLEHLSDAKTIAFVVDASTVSRNGAVVAEFVTLTLSIEIDLQRSRHLHSILHTLAYLPPSQNTPSLIILAHKYDLLNAGSQANMTSDILAVNRVRSVLERELEKRKASQKGGVGVEKLGGEDEKSDMGGLDCNGPPGDPFKFSDWEGGEISFVGTSAKVLRPSDDSGESGGDGLASFREWLDGIA